MVKFVALGREGHLVNPEQVAALTLGEDRRTVVHLVGGHMLGIVGVAPKEVAALLEQQGGPPKPQVQVNQDFIEQI